MVTSKQGFYTDLNPYATELKKDLKNQIYEQISIIRYNFTLGNVQVIYNSVNALADIIIPYLESQNFLIDYNVTSGEIQEKTKRRYTPKNLKILIDFEEKYKSLLNRIRRNPNLLNNNFKYRFEFNEYLHNKFKILIKVAISGGMIPIKKKITEDI